jgi:hypothetical protein
MIVWVRIYSHKGEGKMLKKRANEFAPTTGIPRCFNHRTIPFSPFPKGGAQEKPLHPPLQKKKNGLPLWKRGNEGDLGVSRIDAYLRNLTLVPLPVLRTNYTATPTLMKMNPCSPAHHTREHYI